MISPSITESGWEHYPKRLRNYDPLREDGSSYDARLTKDNKRLFTEKGSMSIDILDVNRDEFFEGGIYLCYILHRFNKADG